LIFKSQGFRSATLGLDDFPRASARPQAERVTSLLVQRSRTYLKIVASEDGLRAAGAQDPEFTGSK